MLLRQQFKTFEGAQKRARFENAHSIYRFRIVACNDDGTPHKDRYAVVGVKIFRLEKLRS